jgi:hypothetical protein
MTRTPTTNGTALNMPSPEDFVSEIDNPYFPLEAGTTFFYRGTREGQSVSSAFVVTHATKDILGVETRVIQDTVYLDGQLHEIAIDWFAQDEEGNVWYFGEATTEYENGIPVSTAGSWEAGVDGAQAGIIMEAHPAKGDTYAQEVAPPVAQDMATVLSLHRHVTVPYGSFKNCLETEEFSPLKPGFVEHKFYARGIGFLKAIAVSGGHETLDLVGISHDEGDDSNSGDIVSRTNILDTGSMAVRDSIFAGSAFPVRPSKTVITQKTANDRAIAKPSTQDYWHAAGPSPKAAITAARVQPGRHGEKVHEFFQLPSPIMEIPD